MNLSDFFKKDVVAMPSGEESASNGFKESKYSKVLSSLGKVVAGVAVATTMVACGPSREEVDAMKAQVPVKDRNELVAAYDSTLLVKIDSLHAAGHEMADAVEKGLDITWEQASKSMPNKRNWDGKEYVVSDHAQARLDESRDAHVSVILMPVTISTGKSTVTTLQSIPVTNYTYKPEFREKLAEKVEARKAEKTAQTVQVARSTHFSR